jgi:Ca-activated chloride channel family protein
MITFDYPAALLGFIVFIPLALADYFSPRRKRIHISLPAKLRAKLYASLFFFRLFLACFIIAMAGPRWGFGQTVNEYRRALDVVIAVDASRSMELTDGYAGAMTRMERGMAIAGEAVAAMPGTRFGVALSRNRGVVAIPLTWDTVTVRTFLEAAGSPLTGRGTNLESLVDAAAGAFQSTHPSTRVILLVSDGEALTGSLKAALTRCGRNDIAVTAIAAGSDEGGIVPGSGGILSRRNTGVMQAAARQTGGVYIDGSNEDAAQVLSAYLQSLTPESLGGGSRKERKARWFIFALLAIIAFGASKLSLLKTGGRR